MSLIGISAGTALGSAIVSKNEAATDAAGGSALRPVFVYPDAIKAAQAALDQAKKDKDVAQVQAKTKEVADLKRDLKSGATGTGASCCWIS